MTVRARAGVSDELSFSPMSTVSPAGRSNLHILTDFVLHLVPVCGKVLCSNSLRQRMEV